MLRARETLRLPPRSMFQYKNHSNSTGRSSLNVFFFLQQIVGSENAANVGRDLDLYFLDDEDSREPLFVSILGFYVRFFLEFRIRPKPHVLRTYAAVCICGDVDVLRCSLTCRVSANNPSPSSVFSPNIYAGKTDGKKERTATDLRRGP